MASRNPGLSIAIRRALCSAVTVPVMLMSSGALAQDDEVELEEIVVTGSRIARDPNIGGNVPVQSLSSDDIQLSGNVDLGETLNRLPALLGSNTSTNSIGGIFGSGSGETAATAEVGETILQLRSLGVERTLVLVNGRRHVAGVGGSQAVDIGSIPQQLIERVEVLTGGASAIYGADAVTGVVNFILKDEFEGFNVDVTGGLSSEGDGSNYSVSGLYGLNFNNERGNFTIGANYTTRESIQHGDRDWSRNNGVASDDQNPALRFQAGDIDPTATPNFARFYSPGTSFASELSPCDQFGFDYCYGFHPTGFPILNQQGFTDLWREAFPGDPDPVFTDAEMALIQRAANAPTRATRSGHNFSLSSPGGVLLPGGVFDPGIDLDGNGVSDCSQSYQGYFSTYDFSPPALGLIGGCWIIEDDGNVRPLRDGLIAGDINQFGPDGIADNFDDDELLPDDWRASVHMTARYDLSQTTSIFFEGKYAVQETETSFPLNTFWDLLTIAPDNPYISQLPADLAAVGQSEGLFITRDPTDIGPNIDTGTRETTRFVVGFEGEMDNGWNWEISGNYGKFDLEFEDGNRLIVDRWFAAIDAVDDGNGNIICRSDIDPTPPPTTPFDIPAFSPGYFTFNPGDGSCRPANILGGAGAISQEAIDFVTDTIVNNFETQQFVFSASVAGDLGDDFRFSAGEIGFAAGAELRTERSKSLFDPLVRGILPVTTDFGQEGDRLEDIAPGLATDDDPFDQRSLVFDSGSLIQDVTGSYDVGDIFGEISVPLLADVPFAQELTFDAAARISNYSTVGTTVTWKAGGSWTPMADTLRFRGGYSVAVRAPNIDELFSPAQGAFFRPVDPCDSAEINALLAANDPRGPIRQANCAAAGIPGSFTDPLTARIVGETSGNPNLQEEEADTITFGFVLTPGFLEGLSFSVDYWDVDIEDAIDAPSDQDIVNSCYDSEQFPDNQFCALVRRNANPNSPQFNGLQFISQQQLNIGSLEATGVDFDVRYRTDIGRYNMMFAVTGTWMDKLDRFFDPTDPTAVDPELGELQRPEWAGTFNVSLATDAFGIEYKMQYLGEQALRDVEIETVDSLFGPAGIADETYIHDLAATFDFSDRYRIYGGINNIGDERPFITEFAFPVNPIGRFFFVGFEANIL
jgi:outer membrane receptor protein involved in Fe transport